MRLKKIYYFPGLISLIGFAFIIPRWHNKIKPLNLSAIKFIVPGHETPCNISWSETYVDQQLRRKKKINFILNEKGAVNKKKMNVIRQEALKLKYTNDTSTVILISLTDSMLYSDFFGLINICKEDNHRTFTLWKKKFVIFGEELPRKKEISDDSQCFLCGDNIVVQKPKPLLNLFEKFLKQIKSFYTFQGLTLLIGWLIILFSFLYFRKRKKHSIPRPS